MIIANLEDKCHWLNAFAPQDYICPNISPAGMILGDQPVDFNHLKLDFGQYCEIHDGTDNSQRPRSIGAIALRPKYQSSGSYYFMSLESGRKVHSNNWIELGITDAVIARVEQLAIQDGVAPMIDGELNFEWAPGVPITDVFDDTLDNPSNPNGVASMNVTNMPVIFDNNGTPSTHVVQGAVEPTPHAVQGAVEPTPQAPFIEEVVDNGDADSVYSNTEDDNNVLQDEENEVDTADEPDDNTNVDSSDELDDNSSDVFLDTPSENPNDDPDERFDDTTTEPETTTDDINESSSLPEISRPQRDRKPPTRYEPSFSGKSYGLQLFNISTSSIDKVDNTSNSHNSNHDLRKNVFNIIFTQMTANKGIKEFGERAVAAIYKEYKQMQDLQVLGNTNYDLLSNDQKRRALRAVNLIKLKRTGTVKGRMCANGAPHRKFIPREEAKSPTVSLDGLMYTALTAAHEKRKVVSFDVPGAFLQADIPKDKFRLLKLEGKYVDIMCEVNPEYSKNVRIENGKKVLYLQILKALYGMIESALLWYELFVTVLQEQGFELNPYDKCIANKIINGSQCTISWYVDDNLITHKDQSVLDDIVKIIEDRFPGLTVTKGDEHTFIGMKMKFYKSGKLGIILKEYLEECIDEFGDDLGPAVTSVAGRWLFQIDDNARKLTTEKADKFHSIVAKLLWVSQRGRPDICVPVSFLCTRVQHPDVEDWKKLRRMLKFIQQTIDDERIIGADKLDEMETFVDSSHAVHPDMRGHTGGLVSLGTGILAPKCSKQKMNSRSTNETEVIGNSEFLPYNIWYDHFIEAQGTKLKKNIWHQDNEGAEKMAKNGRLSCGSNSRHINIKFFWITDRVQQGKITIKHCPTDKMLADYFTKPLQGKKFHLFRRIIMGWDHISTLWASDTTESTSLSSSKERVENNVKANTEKNMSEAKKISWVDVVKNSTQSADTEVVVNNRTKNRELVASRSAKQK